MDGLTEGCIVHYVLPDGICKGEHRPAIIVKVWSDTGTVNLTVFTDHQNDYKLHNLDVHEKSENTNLDNGEHGIMWATSVVYDETKQEGTWHWIEKDIYPALLLSPLTPPTGE